MIVPGLSEEKILEELIFDRKIVANEAKKIAKKFIKNLLKQGLDGIDKEYNPEYTIHTNKNNNNWHCIVSINMAKRPYWSHKTACMVESEQGKKEYYIVRGFSNKKPYFIRISSHAMKRYKERFIEDLLKRKSGNLGGDFAPLVLRHGEIVPWLKVVDPKFWSIVHPFTDSDDLTTLFYTLDGCYLGNITENGNSEFKTYLGWKTDLKKTGETEAVKLCKVAHLIFNKSLHDKSVYDIEDDDIESQIMVEQMEKYFQSKLLP